jgi:hypothetical protein
METIYKKLEIICKRIDNEDLNSIFEEGDDEVIIAQNFYDSLIKSVFSLSSTDFVLPFLKSVDSYRWIESIKSSLDNYSILVNKFLRTINKRKLILFYSEETKQKIGIKTVEERKVFQTLLLHNYLSKRIHDVSVLFNLENHEIISTNYLCKFIYNEVYIRYSDDSLITREELIKIINETNKNILNANLANRDRHNKSLELIEEQNKKISQQYAEDREAIERVKKSLATREVEELELEIQFGTNTSYLAFIHRIGIVRFILDKYCKNESTYNFYKAANILTAINANNIPFDSTRKCISAMINDEDNFGNDIKTMNKDNPMKSPKNVDFITEQFKKLKIDK